MSRYLKEGETVPFGYGFVCHRFDMLATEVAPLPMNYLIRFVRRWQMKSWLKMTRDELRQLDKVQAIVLEAEAKQHIKDMDWFKRRFKEKAHDSAMLRDLIWETELATRDKIRKATNKRFIKEED